MILKKILSTAVIILLLACFVITPINKFCSNSFRLYKINEISDDYLQDTLKKTSASFLISRGINSLVSLAQSIDTGGSAKFLGTGVSGSISPGEILDPLNDMVERFSWVMLASSVSIGIQMFLKEVFPWISTQFLVPIALITVLFAIWMNTYFTNSLLHIAFKLIILSCVLSFIVPTMAYTNKIIYNYSLKNKYSSAISNIETQTEKTKILKDESVLDRFDKLKEKIKYLKNKSSNFFEYLINLMVVFIIQTIVLPLLTLWLFLLLIKYIFNRFEPLQIEKYFKTRIIGP